VRPDRLGAARRRPPPPRAGAVPAWNDAGALRGGAGGRRRAADPAPRRAVSRGARGLRVGGVRRQGPAARGGGGRDQPTVLPDPLRARWVAGRPAAPGRGGGLGRAAAAVVGRLARVGRRYSPSV
ncbi:MAG: hypothetical protein AVDCRST_MAG39-2102, partial [uncultured Sphingomonadaceae bacterium]